jgi:UDP-N-acetylmuramate--alanine ligase
MNLARISYVYFLGIGGIGMSALARFFRASGKVVGGYDKTRSALTDELEQEGMLIHFEENVYRIPAAFKEAEKEEVLVVWTPAIPEDHAELDWFRAYGYNIQKRAQVLGLITDATRTFAVAGTHGKTTTTTLAAHLLRSGGVDCSAFLGGISGNYHTNLLLGNNLGKENVPMEQNVVVVEADEYDRSFLWLHPAAAIVTSVDADHLDIYGDENEMHNAYRQFISQVSEKLVTKKSVLETLGLSKAEKFTSYSLDDTTADSFAENIRVENGYYTFDLVIDGQKISNLRLGLPGRHNLENAVAAATVARFAGVDDESLRLGLESFRGVARRFDYHVRSSEVVYIDDYGHHPAELQACISSVRELYPEKKITGIFQPHLYSRTRDFADEFAQSLGLLDDVVLLDIYPAREKPIAGVTSSMLLQKINAPRKTIYKKEELVEKIMTHDFDVLLTMGAGDIDRMVKPLTAALKMKFSLQEETK